VDTTKTITHVSLCAGYGGIDLGLARAIPNLRTIAFSEIEAFACANLVAKMEKGLLDIAPIWTDLKTFPWAEFRDRVDILSGGYPCQPFSAAGKRLGTEDPRHLWPYISNGIAAMRPSVCFFENVEGHISLGLPDVIEDLGRMGYRSTWGIFSASEVGAPHQRKRVFIMAHRYSNGSPSGFPRQEQGDERKSGEFDNGCGQIWPSQPGQPQHKWEPPRVVVNPKEPRLQGGGESHTQEWEEHSSHGASIFGGTANSSNDGATEVMGNSEHDGLPSSKVSEGGDHELHGFSSRQNESQQPTGTGRSNDNGDISEGERRVVGDSRCIVSKGAKQQSAGIEQYGEEPMGNSQIRGNRQLTTQQQRGDSFGGSMQEGGEVGNSANQGCQRSRGSDDSGGQFFGFTKSDRSGGHGDMEQEQRETQPSVGGNTNGTACGMGYAELSVSCDNRTDELRLLGNGVVPATATLAFRFLLKELTTNPTK